ncbi:MAG: hypothetical protein V2B18_16655 [Pseudomonadota bacterium]
MAYEVVRDIRSRRNTGRLILSIQGKRSRLVLWRETYEMIRQRLPNKTNFKSIRFLVDADQPNKFVLEPMPNEVAPGAVKLNRSKYGNIVGCSYLLRRLSWAKDRTVRLEGRWISGMSPAAVEFDIRKRVG